MEFKKNINGKMALGYGSKYQLLRMLGWHRNEFNKKIAETLKLESDGIVWLDFGYDGPCDSELLNLDFIKDLKAKWREYWACGRTGINWDAVGIAPDGSYIFVEAKAHLSELYSHAGGCAESVEKNNARIKEFLAKYHINSDENCWNNENYQLANRLIITDFVNAAGLKAHLVYVLFENGYEYNAPANDSASKEEWEEAIKKEKAQMGIAGTEAEKMINYCIIDCNRK